GIEEHLRLEHEAVTHDADIGAVAEDRAQASEEFRAIASELLDAPGEREVEALAEIGEPRLTLLVLAFGRFERGFQCGKLAAQRRDLLIEQFDLRERAAREALFGFERGREFVGLAGADVEVLVRAFEAVALSLGRREARAQRSERILEIALAELFQREKL